MPRYCDVNGDKRITLSEWLNCLQAVPRVRTPEVAKPAIGKFMVLKSFEFVF